MSMMFIVYVPLILGVIMLLFAKLFGAQFARLGKANWQIHGFEKTDIPSVDRITEERERSASGFD